MSTTKDDRAPEPQPSTPAAGWAVRGVAAWFDFWVGFYFDRPKRRLYFLPIPCLGWYLQFPTNTKLSGGGAAEEQQQTERTPRRPLK